MSAFVLAPACLFFTYQGGLAFVVMILAFAVLAHWEWHSVATDAPILHLAPALAACLAAQGAVFLDRTDIAAWMVMAGVGLALVAARRGRRGWAMIGVLYVALPGMALISLRQSGLELVVWLFVVIWMTDIGAYLVGRTFGGPRLWPQVSPGKTWSGAVGGAVTGAVSGWLVGTYLFDLTFSPWMIVGLSLVLSVAGQLGDLVESAWKRHFNVKDSGRIIPGHGGVMDRLDSLVTAAVVMIGIREIWGTGL